ncbi:tRNA (adenosine(37)-N6)-threonylcarbamoyltransferase complex dimerization subunit type 1 TsaB [soil metagenome]
MRLLAFETATPLGGAALLIDGVIVGERTIEGSSTHSRHCLAFAEELLRGADLAWKDLTAVAASHGPGSFTGVRTGLTLVKGLAWSLGIPCVSVSTLEAMALHAAGAGHEYILPVLDARMKETYAALFLPRNATSPDWRFSPGNATSPDWRFSSLYPTRLTEDLCLTPEALIARVLTHAPADKILLCGEGAKTYAPIFTTAGFPFAERERFHACPSAVAILASRAIEDGKAMTPENLAALYLRDATRPPGAGSSA